MAVHRRQLRPDLRPADGGDRQAGTGQRSRLCDQRAALREPRRARRSDRRLDPDPAGQGGRSDPGSRRRAVLPPVRHRRLRRRPAFPRPQVGAVGGRPADRPNLHPGPAIRLDGERPRTWSAGPVRPLALTPTMSCTRCLDCRAIRVNGAASRPPNPCHGRRRSAPTSLAIQGASCSLRHPGPDHAIEIGRERL